MISHLPPLYFILFCLSISLCSCNHQKENGWVVSFSDIGSYSSPRTAHLNQDSVLDIVIGAGKNEFLALDKGVIALDGKDGHLLWSCAGTDQIVGSAIFTEVTGDGIPDVFIGGRKAQLYGIDGASGELLWTFKTTTGPTKAHEYTRYNFYNPQLIPDQNGDGIEELLVSNGGNVDAPPRDMFMRFPGTLAIINSQNGELLHVATMPDSMETYMSPVVHDFYGNGDLEIIFGSGGETIGGGLFRGFLQQLLTNDLSQATPLITNKGHGFIAPVSLADLNDDAVLDIIANWHGGTMYAIDGKTNEILWQVDFPKTEFNNSPVIGYFNDDAIPDVFSYYSKGEWPNSLGTIHFVVNGLTGELVFQKALGCSSIGSGVAFDYDNDGFDEIAVSINEYNCLQFSNQDINHTLYLFDFNDKKLIPLDPTPSAKNISSTPWIGDLDNDQRWDLVYPIMTNSMQLYEVDGMLLKRKSLDYSYQKPPAWGGYMGTNYNGVFDH